MIASMNLSQTRLLGTPSDDLRCILCGFARYASLRLLFPRRLAFAQIGRANFPPVGSLQALPHADVAKLDHGRKTFA
jgi:hypothetical protein